MKAAIARTSNMPKHILAPTQYREYTPTFQADPRPGVASQSNRRTRYVATGILTCKNLIDSEHVSQRDSDVDEMKEMIMEHLGTEEASGFSIDEEGEDNSLDMELDLW
jgi:hypothetical protein